MKRHNLLNDLNYLISGCRNFVVLSSLFSFLAFSAGVVTVSVNAEEIPLDVVDIYFELNDTDGDLGIHALIDGEPWRSLEIEDHNGQKILTVKNKGRLARQGLTELFFESAEPSFDELSPEQFFRRFPEGIYEVEGKTLEGDELDGEAEITHVIPAPPENIMVSGELAAEDCDSEELPEVSDPVVLSWDPVTTSHPEIGKDSPINIVKYQVVVEREEPETLVLSIDLPPDKSEIEIPSDFIELGDEFKFEILVRESSGNQTAVESCFEIAE